MGILGGILGGVLNMFLPGVGSFVGSLFGGSGGSGSFSHQMAEMRRQNEQMMMETRIQQQEMLRFQRRMDMQNQHYSTLSTAEASKHKAITEMLHAIK